MEILYFWSCIFGLHILLALLLLMHSLPLYVTNRVGPLTHGISLSLLLTCSLPVFRLVDSNSCVSSMYLVLYIKLNLQCSYLKTFIFIIAENDVRKYLFTLGNNVHLKCVPLSNLARVVWKFNGSRIQDKDSKYLLYDGGIAIFNVTVAETGFYDCLSVEKSKAKEFFITVARYALYAHQNTEKANVNAATDDNNEAEAVGFQSSLSTYLLKDATKQKSVGSQKENLLLKLLSAGFALLFFFLFIWNFYKGHISLPWKIREASSKDTNADLENPELTTGRSGAVRESSAIQTNMSFLNE